MREMKKNHFCKLCNTLLTDQEQFIGHLIHAHEFKDDEARNAWQMGAVPKALEVGGVPGR